MIFNPCRGLGSFVVLKSMGFTRWLITFNPFGIAQNITAQQLNLISHVCNAWANNRCESARTQNGFTNMPQEYLNDDI